MIKVYIKDSGYACGKNIWIVSKSEGRTRLIKPFNMEFIDEDPTGMNEPTMRLSGELCEEFMKAFAEALDNSGIKTDNDFKIKGLLEAKDAHLQDMRKLVFDGK